MKRVIKKSIVLTVFTLVAVSCLAQSGFVANTVNGVAVDFGTSSGSSELTSLPPTLNGNQFQLNMAISGMELLSWTPDQILVTGAWYVPGGTNLPTDVVSAQVCGSYSGTLTNVGWSNPGTYQNRINASRTDWPFLNTNGSIATATFELSQTGLDLLAASNGNAYFQGTYAFYRNGVLLEEGVCSWSGTIQ